MTATTIDPHGDRRAEAERLLLGFVGVTAATGAIPVPSASVAIVAENAVMINVLASAMGVPVSLLTVVSSMGTLAAVNRLGKAVFIEGARAIGWFAGPLGVAGISALGAFTAGLQAWVVGQLVIAISEHGGKVLDVDARKAVLDDARERFERDVWARVKGQKVTS